MKTTQKPDKRLHIRKNVAGGATGAVLGAVVGGPMGALVGGVIGTAVGTTAETGGLADLQSSTTRTIGRAALPAKRIARNMGKSVKAITRGAARSGGRKKSPGTKARASITRAKASKAGRSMGRAPLGKLSKAKSRSKR